jgi:hypothetical protein
MTENEAIEELKYDCNELGKAIPCDTSWGKSFENAYAMAIKALEEVQQYRKIGTPEECRAAVEKQTAKKVEIWNDGSEHCPCCDKNNSYLGFKVCIECGQLLDWNEET